MTAKIRNLPRDFAPTHRLKFDNILVSGCSFTFNNSEEHVCSWPYYLRNHTDANEIYDCSQSGAGNNHIFNSVVNELETNKSLTPDNTLIIVMWSGLSRTDVIATQDITAEWHHMSNYHFDDKFSTLTIFGIVDGKTPLDELCKKYKTLVDSDAQIYESLLKIIALKNYLENRGFNYVFTSFQDPLPELSKVNSPMTKSVRNSLEDLPYLREYSIDSNRVEPCGHPTPDCYAQWTREHLIPYLRSRGYCTELQ